MTFEFQFTLPHGERPTDPILSTLASVVSIHAPAWGATIIIGPFLPTLAFQFTLPHGERPPPRTCSSRPRCFNSRSRMGSDKILFPSLAVHGVSIHAPAWGATNDDATHVNWFTGFNSRSRMGSDHRGQQEGRRRREFQFTLPHGERLSCGSPLPFSLSFQFTLPHGERHEANIRRVAAAVFQFTLPHGERLCLLVWLATYWSFNSRSRMGSDAAASRLAS